jgi:hypothetical protein
MPARFDEDYVVLQRSDGHRARLVVKDVAGDRAEFERRHHVEVTPSTLNLESIFPYLVGKDGSPVAIAFPERTRSCCAEQY